jgi:hypothetical protein
MKINQSMLLPKFRGVERTEKSHTAAKELIKDILHFSGRAPRHIEIVSLEERSGGPPAALKELIQGYSNAVITNIELVSRDHATLTINGKAYEFWRNGNAQNRPPGDYQTRYALESDEWLPLLEKVGRFNPRYIPSSTRVTVPVISFYLHLTPERFYTAPYGRSIDNPNHGPEVMYTEASHMSSSVGVNRRTRSQNPEILAAAETFFRNLEQRVFTNERLGALKSGHRAD